MNPYVLLALVAAILAAGAGGFKLGADHELASQKRLDDQVRKVEAAVQNKNAELIATLRPKYTTIQNKLEKQIETQTIFRDCRLDSVSFGLLNAALAAPSDQKADLGVSGRKLSEGSPPVDAPTP